jgi:protein TonB
VGGARPDPPSPAAPQELDLPGLPPVDASSDLLGGEGPAAERGVPARADEMSGRLRSLAGGGRPGRGPGPLRVPEDAGGGGAPAGAGGEDPGAGEGTGGGRGVGSRSGGRRPAYPDTARREGLEGVVTLEITVEPDGRVSEVVVAKSSGHACLDESAVEAARTWIYEPARLNGAPVAAKIRVPVRFALTD